MKIKFCLAGALAGALLSSSAMAAPRFKLVKLVPPAGATSSVARAISANGSIAGEARIGSEFAGNSPVDFGNVGALATNLTATTTTATDTFTRGVNDSGIAAGTALDSVGNTSTAIVTGTGGVTTLASAPGLSNAGAYGINNAGTVVGYSASIAFFGGAGTARPMPSGQGVQKATVWTAGVATTLANPLGNFNSLATATAVPEPSSWAMMIVGFGLVGAAARGRRAAFA